MRAAVDVQLRPQATRGHSLTGASEIIMLVHPTTSPICLEMGNAREHTKDLLIFHSNGFDCAFPLEAVREIVPMARLSSPPGMPTGLRGFLDLRGTAIPILRLDRFLDLPEQLAGLHTPMIVLRGVLGSFGILVGSVRGIVPIASVQFLDIPEGRTFQGCARASIELDG